MYTFFSVTDALRRCSPTMPQESPLREPHMPVMPPGLASGRRKLKSDGPGQCLYLVWDCSRKLHGNLVVSYYQLGVVADTCQNRQRGCLFLYFVFQSQGKPASTVVPPSKSLWFKVQPTTTTQLRFLICKNMCVGALFWVGPCVGCLGSFRASLFGFFC